MPLHLRSSAAFSIIVALTMPIMPTAFAMGSMSLLLVPHCTEQSNCPEFAASDGEHFVTNQLAAGDILDLDVLVRGPDFATVRSVRSWIKYDKKILEARSIELSPALPSPTPGEQSIDAAQELIRIGGSTPNGFSSEDTRIARVTFRVIESATNTELSFDGYNDSGNGHTAVNGARQENEGTQGSLPPPPCFDNIIGCRGSNTPLLSGEPAKLIVQLSGAMQSSASASETTSTSSMSSSSSVIQNDPVVETTSSEGIASSASSLTGQGSSFSILQVQDVRVTTKDSVIFLGWQALSSAELAGYNVYYGTVSGRYIQRRSLPASSTSLVLRDLEPGTTYFLAVRAVNAQDQESVFSQEVSVTVGSPETATSPMTRLPQDSGAVAGNPLETRGETTIKGETGSASVLMWAFLTSAFIGTAFAFRRQLTLASHVS